MNRISFLAIGLIFLCCLDLSLGYPSTGSCFGQICPKGTTNCRKHSESTPDKKHINVKISCLDDLNGSLKEYHFEEASYLDPYTHYKSTSYQSLDSDDDTNNNLVNVNNNSYGEDFL